MRESIRGFADAVLEDASDDDGDGVAALAALADGLSGLRQLLVTSDDLRRVLSDPGLAVHIRRGVITDLLSSQVADGAVRVVVHAIDVDRAPEFVEDVEWLAARFEAARHGQVPVAELPVGRTAATERLDGYATAVLEGVREEGAASPEAESTSLDEVEDELFRFSRAVDGSEQLRSALTNRDVPVHARQSLVRDLLADRATPASTRLAGYAARVGRPRDYPVLLTALVERVADESQRQVAEVRAATDLSEEQQTRLSQALSQMVGRDIDVRVVVDPAVLGGFVASIGDSVVDGSARHRLDQLRERLVLPDSNITT